MRSGLCALGGKDIPKRAPFAQHLRSVLKSPTAEMVICGNEALSMVDA